MPIEFQRGEKGKHVLDLLRIGFLVDRRIRRHLIAEDLCHAHREHGFHEDTFALDDEIVRPFEAGMKLWKAGFYVRFGGDTLQFGPTFNSKAADLDRMFDAVGEALNQID